MQQAVLHDIDYGTGEVPQDGEPSDFACIPKELDVLHSHRCDSRSRTNDQNGAACTGAVGDELPQEAVGRVLVQSVHAHRSRNQRHVVHYRAYEPEQEHDRIEAADRLTKPAGERGQQPCVLESSDSDNMPTKNIRELRSILLSACATVSS